MFELSDIKNKPARIRVLGIGGAGCNATDYMMQSGLEGVDFTFINTDSEALKRIDADSVIQLGEELTRGLGCGGNLEVGYKAAIEGRERIIEELKGTDFLFITVGMGGGTGGGASPVVASIAKEMGILTVAIVTMPFAFEGKVRFEKANAAIDKLEPIVDTLIVVPNDSLLSAQTKSTSLIDAFNASDERFKNCIQGITDLINRPGMINVDLDDVRCIMGGMGRGVIGSGEDSGSDKMRAIRATKAALENPLLAAIDLKQASGFLVNITAGLDLSLGEFSEVGNLIEERVSQYANIVIGTVIEPEMSTGIKISVIATGFVDGVNTKDISDQSLLKKNLTQKKIRIVARDNTSDLELAELIEHLSNVYRSVGGDELVVTSVNNIPPNTSSDRVIQPPVKRGVV